MRKSSAAATCLITQGGGHALHTVGAEGQPRAPMTRDSRATPDSRRRVTSQATRMTQRRRPSTRAPLPKTPIASARRTSPPREGRLAPQRPPAPRPPLPNPPIASARRPPPPRERLFALHRRPILEHLRGDQSVRIGEV